LKRCLSHGRYIDYIFRQFFFFLYQVLFHLSPTRARFCSVPTAAQSLDHSFPEPLVTCLIWRPVLRRSHPDPLARINS